MSVRVLHYVGKMNRGGMETFIMNLYRKIDREVIQFDFAVHGTDAGDFEDEITTLGGKFYYFPPMRKNPLKYRRLWRDFWQKNKNNYVAFHMHTNSLANIIALDEAEKSNIPIRIVHSHSSMADKGYLQWLNDYLHKRHQRKLSFLATNLFACSDKASEWLFGGNTINELNVQQINNGIDTEKFKFDSVKRDKIRKKLDVQDNKVIGHIGAFIPVKNHKLVVDIVERAYMKDQSVRCILIGDGILYNEIKDIVHQRSLDDVIIFLGVCDNIDELLSAMDIFLMPSLYEGLPVSLVEVQTNGLPSLISDSITKDVQMRDNLHYFPLSDSAESWADEALNILAKEIHEVDIENIIKSGFDIKSTVSVYENTIVKGKKSYAADQTERAEIE